VSSTFLLAQAQEVTEASGTAGGAWLLIAFPLLGAAVLLFGGKATNAWGHLLGCLTVVASFVYGVMLFFSSTGLPENERVQNLHIFDWIPVGNLQVEFGMRVDPLSISFVLLITGVGALIHIYSIGYMADDPDRRRFFGYFNLFVAAMLILVLGNSFVTLYLGWEGVGLASYLLIGWYTNRPSAATAAKKAFLMNRVGDVGLALAIFILFANLGTTQYTESSPTSTNSRRPRSPRSRSCCCWAPAVSPARSRCRRGCPTRWRARPRSRP